MKTKLQSILNEVSIGNLSLPFIFRFLFPSLLGDYNIEKHSLGFHSRLPSCPDELERGKTSAHHLDPAVKAEVLWASNTSSVFGMQRTSPSLQVEAWLGPSQVLTWEGEGGLGFPCGLKA